LPKPRKSLSQLAESGTLGRNPGRYVGRFIAQTAPVRPIGAPPKHLSPALRDIWKELVKAAQPGLLQRSDKFFIELCCNVVFRMRAPDTKPSELNALASILSKLAMNPSDRAKLDLPSPTKTSAKSEEEKQWDALSELD